MIKQSYWASVQVKMTPIVAPYTEYYKQMVTKVVLELKELSNDVPTVFRG